MCRPFRRRGGIRNGIVCVGVAHLRGGGGCRVDCRGAVFLKFCRRWGKKVFGGLICRVRG